RNRGLACRIDPESRHDDHTHPVHLAITVKKVEKNNLPPFDDDLVKKVSGEKVSTPDEFRESMRKDLERYWNDQAERKLEDAIAQELVRMHDFPVPESIVNSFLDAFVDDIKGKSRDRKLPRNFDEQKFREESRSYAIWQSRWMLLKERIAEVESLKVTDDELEKLAEIDATRIGVEKERLMDYYKVSSAGTERLLTNKLMALLKLQAKITEKMVEEPAKHHAN
ncbi:MAG: hypothetical protein AAB393_16340, partial [Bacteroidota bacterium]